MVNISIDTGDSDLACVVNQFLDRPNPNPGTPSVFSEVVQAGV